MQLIEGQVCVVFLNIKIIKQWFTEQIAFPLNKFNYNFLKDKIYLSFCSKL